MKLSKVHVKDFHSIRDSNEFDIGDVTCLVGKNEAGKTAILQAIYKLMPIVDTDMGYSVTDDYPRRDVSDYEYEIEQGTRKHAVVATLTYELDDDDLDAVAKTFGKDALTSRTLTISKRYEQESVSISLDIDDQAAIHHLISHYSLTDEVREKLEACTTPQEMNTAIEGEEQTEAIQGISRLADALAKSGSIEIYIFNQIIRDRVPDFLYFDDYYQMKGCDNIDALKCRVDNKALEKHDYPMLGLINKARLDLDSLLNPDRTRDLKNKLEGAGNHLTKSIVKYWSQNIHLQMRFDVRPAQPQDPEGMRSGTNIWAEVYDTRHQVTTELGTRSKGFVWFFSFLAWYGDIQRERRNVILLLDEPGMSLHGKAQADLLRYFEEELAPNHQLIYTTHSPFMVDAQRFDRVRIVQDKGVEAGTELPREEEGTKVSIDVLEASEDSLFPLQGALGYDISQSLFVGPNSLIVEGVSDLLYLQILSSALGAASREGLSAEWTITPVGGADKVPTFVALLGSQSKMNIAALIDYQKKDKQAIENMWKRKLIARKNVLTYADFVEGDEADVEDLFGATFYLTLVNAEYAESLDAKINAKSLSAKSPRLIRRLDQYFTQNPLKNKVVFNHYRPARYLAENLSGLKIPETVLDRFESMFKEVNKRLPKI